MNPNFLVECPFRNLGNKYGFLTEFQDSWNQNSILIVLENINR
jgi:hypothetical protein